MIPGFSATKQALRPNGMNNQPFGGCGFEHVTVGGDQFDGFSYFFSETKRRGEMQRVERAKRMPLDECRATANSSLVRSVTDDILFLLDQVNNAWDGLFTAFMARL